jgi:hypothetical protein
MHDLTEQVAAVVTSSGIQTGTVNIFNVGSTAAVGTIEFEPGLQRDLLAILDKLIPLILPSPLMLWNLLSASLSVEVQLRGFHI